MASRIVRVAASPEPVAELGVAAPEIAQRRISGMILPRRAGHLYPAIASPSAVPVQSTTMSWSARQPASSAWRCLTPFLAEAELGGRAAQHADRRVEAGHELP